MQNKQNRASNFDLLKIILIVMVIVLHYFNGSMGGMFSNESKWSLNYFLSHIIESFCIIAVNTFVIITGYFSCKKNSIKISKVIKLYSIAILYGVVIGIAVIIGTKRTLSLAMLKQIIKVSFNRWYVVTYCVLYLLIPFINKLIASITKKELETLLIINAIIFYLIYTLFFSGTIPDGGYGLVNFINLYIVGSYIRLYKNDYNSKKVPTLVYIACTAITTVYSFFFMRAWQYATIFNLVSSAAFFMIFKNINLKNNKIINALATYTFTIYIIHENTLITKFLYRNIFRSDLFWNSNLMIFHLIITAFGIFLMCVIIEWLRRKIIGKIFDNQIDKIKFEIKCK